MQRVKPVQQVNQNSLFNNHLFESLQPALLSLRVNSFDKSDDDVMYISGMKAV